MSDPTKPGATPEPNQDDPNPATPSSKAGATPDEPLGDNGKKALDEERKARKAAEKRIADLEAAQTKREQDEAAKRGEWEKVANDRQADIERLNGEIKQRDRSLLVAKVAAKHQLPDELASRLTGETEAELDEDAKSLAKLVKPRQAPDTEAGAGTKGNGAGPSDKPKPKKYDEGKPLYTFEGRRPIVRWPDR